MVVVNTSWIARYWASVLLCLAVLCGHAGVAAAVPTQFENSQQQQLQQLRQQVGNHIQLHAYDLLDELVLAWAEHPLFEEPTPVLLGGITAPVSLNSGMEALLENHLIEVLLRHPQTNIQLCHCPTCATLQVTSGPKETIFARGIDQPLLLQQRYGSQHILLIDVEAEGDNLLLRARIAQLGEHLFLRHSKTLSTHTATAPLLRSGEPLPSASQAKADYTELLQERSLYQIPLRLTLRTYKAGDTAPIMLPPFVWLQGGIEGSLSQARAWRASLSAGLSWAPDSHLGLLTQARLSRLISGNASSLVRPDLYLLAGVSVITLIGPSALLLQEVPITMESVIEKMQDQLPQATYAALQLGLEVRLGQRIAAAAFVEHLPQMNNVPAIGNFVEFASFPLFHSLGFEVSFCF